MVMTMYIILKEKNIYVLVVWIKVNMKNFRAVNDYVQLYKMLKESPLSFSLEMNFSCISYLWLK